MTDKELQETADTLYNEHGSDFVMDYRKFVKGLYGMYAIYNEMTVEIKHKKVLSMLMNTDYILTDFINEKEQLEKLLEELEKFEKESEGEEN